jgi:hypothetical protein
VKRSPKLRRTKGLARGGRLGRNAKRSRKLRTYQHGTTERTRWFRSLPCVCQGQHPACTGGWSEPSHVVSRGAGGTASDIVPMSRGCHQAWHDHGQLTWCARSGLPPLKCEAGECHTDDCSLILATLRHLARAHYATQGPDAPLPGDPT